MANKQNTEHHTTPVMVRLKKRDLDRLDAILENQDIANRTSAIRIAIRILKIHGHLYYGEIREMVDKFGRALDE